MEKENLREELIAVLWKMYGMEVFTNLMEFCQGELRALLWLAGRGGDKENIPSVMAKHLHVSRGRVTSTLNSLRAKGYVTMEICSKDRRRMIISITESGIAYVDEKQALAEGFVAEFIDKIGEERARNLIETLSLTGN